jgi:U3 small nucleolar RNA-associated protein 21
VIAVGFADGLASVHDIKNDDQIMRVRMDGGNITSIAFRTDGQEMLATSNAVGHIAFWDLNERGRLLHIIRGAHDGSASCIQWIPGQPILVSSGDDNSLKVHLY